MQIPYSNTQLKNLPVIAITCTAFMADYVYTHLVTRSSL